MSSLESLREIAQSLVPLRGMSDAHLDALLQEASVDPLFSHQVLFEAGSYSRQHLYLLYGDVELQYPNGDKVLVKGRSTVLPLAHSQPRPCRAIALSHGSVLRIDSERLDRLLTWSQVADYLQLDISYQQDLDEDADWIMSIIRSNLFLKVPPTNAEQIYSHLKPVVVEAGEVVLRQGEVGDGCYFIREGQARVTRAETDSAEAVWLADIEVGRCFGEDALVNEVARNATVTMLTDGVLMRLDKSDFISLLLEPQVRSASLEAMAADATLLDVRTKNEYECGHLLGAVNVPLSLLRLQLRQLDKNKTYCIYCNSGRRATAAAYFLQSMGFDVSILSSNLDSQVSAGAILSTEGTMLKQVANTSNH